MLENVISELLTLGEDDNNYYINFLGEERVCKIEKQSDDNFRDTILGLPIKGEMKSILAFELIVPRLRKAVDHIVEELSKKYSIEVDDKTKLELLTSLLEIRELFGR